MDKQEPKKKEEERKNPLEGKNVNVIHPGDKQKTVLLITDGKNVQVQLNEVNILEAEMMLTKALIYIRKN